MSLSEAVLEIAQQIEDDANHIERLDPSITRTMVGYARQLRSAVKAAGDRPAVRGPLLTPDSRRTESGLLLPGDAEIKEAASRAEGLRRASAAVERTEPIMVRCEGGDYSGQLVPTDPRAPDGARTEMGGDIYVLKTDIVHDPHGGKSVNRKWVPAD